MSLSGLILDFGGVIVQSAKGEGWEEKVTDLIGGILHGTDTDTVSPTDADANATRSPLVSRETIVADVVAGETAVKLLRNALSRPRFPEEVSHESYVLDFIAADWPDEARELLQPHAAEICYSVGINQEVRTLRTGIVELLAWCKETGIPVSIASNALSGQVHRDFLAEHSLSEYFVAEIYSDEAGVRKPNPHLIWQAAEAINVPVEECWYVGDRIDRDVLCGVRAGVGATVLTPVPGASTRPFTVLAEPTYTFDDPAGLLNHLQGLSS